VEAVELPAAKNYCQMAV